MADPHNNSYDLLSFLPTTSSSSSNPPSNGTPAPASDADDPFSFPFPYHSNPTTTSTMPLDQQPAPRATPRVFDRFDDSPSDDDEGIPGFSISSTSNYTQKLDYMMQYLDRKLTKDSPPANNTDTTRPLPEFAGTGGGTGIYRLPVRAAVRPDRPPSLEVRPHPLRETQTGQWLRTMVANESQLWAGGDNGVRIWELSELYNAGREDMRVIPGDEMSAPFWVSAETPGVSCMVEDEGKGVVWSGHCDGKIRCWMMAHRSGRNGFMECLSWQAHQGPVLSMTISSYGDLWSGTQSGIIKIWPWEAIEKALSLTEKERHMASLLVERAYIDLRNQVTINGFCYMFASDVKFLASDRSSAKVWSAGPFTFALWHARTRELLKVFNTDGQIDNWVDAPAMQDISAEDELKLKFVAVLKKEKPQGSFSFLQKSRNVLFGAADAVRRAAVKGTFGEDNRRTEAISVTIDGMIWTGCTSGLIVRWDGNGNRLQEFQHHPFAVQCFSTFGLRIWVGYASGCIQVLDLNGKLLGEWVAHSAPVIKMSIGACYMFSLASHGGIRGWNLTSPGPIDNVLRSELCQKEFLYTKVESLKILAGTWNVAEERTSPDSLISWLGLSAKDADMVVVGLQELEMGAGALAMSAAKETVGLEGSAVGQLWLEMIGSVLDEGSTFSRVGSRQLAGIFIAVWVRNKLRVCVGDVDVAAVPCGFGRAIGNKGAVGLRLRMHDRIMCFVSGHFAAHVEAVNRRNADFDHAYRTMVFKPYNLSNPGAAGVSSAAYILRGTNALGGRSEEGIPELSEADMVIFLGDFNYRLDGISYDEARDFISQRCFDWLREKDQLKAEMEAGRVFQGLREAVITFPPTYKFDKYQPGLAGYDSGEKKRIPAWCDRILYRDSRSSPASECSLDCPVVGSVLQYEACMDVLESDHKPVRSIFHLDIACVDESVRRQEYGEVMQSNKAIDRILQQQISRVADTIISTSNIILQNNDTSILRITNRSGTEKALFTIRCEGESDIGDDGTASNHSHRGSFGLPLWLEVKPATGIIQPDRTAEVSVQHEEFHTQEEYVDGVPQNSWCEDTRDKEVMLVAQIIGGCTAGIKSRRYRIRVRHCPSAKSTNQMFERSSGTENDQQRNVNNHLLHRSNLQKLGTSLDMFDQLLDLNTP